MRIIIVHPSVKLFHYLAGGVLCALSGCTVAPSPTEPSALGMVDARMPAGVDPAFYRAFLQNALEAPQRLEPIRLLRGSIRVYLQTRDNAGEPIDDVTLHATERTLIDGARIWSGGTFGVIGIMRGAETREKVPGWITVKWTSDPPAGSCGRSTVGVDGGFIELNVSGACSCGKASRVYSRLIRHELGHAMGYYHTDDPDDVMFGRAISSAQCEATPSERERRLARFVHAELR